MHFPVMRITDLSEITVETLQEIARGQGEPVYCDTLPDMCIGASHNQAPGAIEFCVWNDDPITPFACERDFEAAYNWLSQAESNFLSHGSDAYWGFVLRGAKPAWSMKRARQTARQYSKWHLRPYLAHTLGLLGQIGRAHV